MKKIILSLLAIFAYITSISAQTMIGVGYALRTIPAPFTYNHSTYIYQENNGVIDLYDLSLNKVETVTLNEEYKKLEIDGYVFADGFEDSGITSYLCITQTFFNDDADWEYMVPIWDGIHESVIGYTVKKTDGTILGSFSHDKWHPEVSIINNVIFPFTMEYDYDSSETTYFYYTLPEFRKYLFEDPNNVKAIPAITRTINKETYDIAGRNVSDSTRGIVVKEGKKMINK